MRTVTVPALRDFEHNGQSYRRGDQVTVTALEASILKRRGDITLSSGLAYQTREMTAEPAGSDAPRRRRRRSLEETSTT